MDFPTWISDPSTGTIFGFASFLLSSAFAYWLYRKALSRSDLAYAQNDLIILGAPASGWSENLDIKFQGQPVSQVTATIVAFWNAGNQTIHGKQICEDEPLSVSPDGGTILQAYIIAGSRAVIKPSIETREGRKTAAVVFDFLDPGDGFAVSVVHSDVTGTVDVAGSLRGVPNGPRRLKRSWGAFIFATIGGAILPGLAFVIAPRLLPIAQSGVWQTALSMGGMIGMITLGLFSRQVTDYFRLRGFPKRLRDEPRIASLLPHLLSS